MTNRTAYNVTAEEAESYLEALQYEKNIINIPNFVFLCILFIIGITGNPLIIHVYSRERKKTATTLIILSIAVCDLVSTIYTIPVTMYVNMRSLFMKSVIVCKIYFFVNLFNGAVSLFLLLAVAFVRYRKICFPFSWQVEKRHTHAINAASVLFGACLVTFHVIVHGRQATETAFPGVRAYQCRVDDAFLGTLWPMAFVGTVNSIVLLFSAFLTYMYVQIGLQARRQRSRGRCLEERTRPGPSQKVENFTIESKKRRSNGRTTLMLFTATVIYVSTYSTTTGLILARALNNKLILNLGPVEASLYSLFFNIYLINCAINPIVYSLWNKKFRQQCRDVFRRKK